MIITVCELLRPIGEDPADWEVTDRRRGALLDACVEGVSGAMEAWSCVKAAELVKRTGKASEVGSAEWLRALKKVHPQLLSAYLPVQPGMGNAAGGVSVGRHSGEIPDTGLTMARWSEFDGLTWALQRAAAIVPPALVGFQLEVAAKLSPSGLSQSSLERS